ncbi:MAG TPA: GNAT family N-acetyltransferase [Vicinamibacterales bacterium]|nr:GNAT family N-acetyltransferase [Vicinamibacterales bacterium]
MTSARISAPEHLKAEHDLNPFDCGTPELDVWLKRRALQNEALGASRTYVVTAEGRVVGYYALANGAVTHKNVSAKTRRNMPDPIPVMVLARLAVDKPFQGQGLGAALVRDALLRTFNASQIAGIRAVLLHAISADAKCFYEKFGFYECPVDPMTMMITLAEVEKNLRPPDASSGG